MLKNTLDLGRYHPSSPAHSDPIPANPLFLLPLAVASDLPPTHLVLRVQDPTACVGESPFEHNGCPPSGQALSFATGYPRLWSILFSFPGLFFPSPPPSFSPLPPPPLHFFGLSSLVLLLGGALDSSTRRPRSRPPPTLSCRVHAHQSVVSSACCHGPAGPPSFFSLSFLSRVWLPLPCFLLGQACHGLEGTWIQWIRLDKAPWAPASMCGSQQVPACLKNSLAILVLLLRSSRPCNPPSSD